MRIALLLVTLLGVLGCNYTAMAEHQETPQFPATDWPWWRGQNRDGVAAADQSPPLSWSEKENVIWKAEVPGRGHSSPIIVGERVFLTTADEKREIQSVLCYAPRQRRDAVENRRPPGRLSAEEQEGLAGLELRRLRR